MADVGAALAEAFLDRCAVARLTPDPRLRILDHLADGRGRAEIPDGEDTPAERTHPDETLGVLHERLVTAGERRGRGAWYTPAWLAEHLVSLAVARPCVVADPACGGGVFLVAAAERLHGFGEDPAVVVGELLWGGDVDPVAVAVSEAELWLWSARHGAPTVAGQRLVVIDSLVDVGVPRAGAVVGNPPFLGQLKKATSIGTVRRAALVERWGSAVRPYTDASWLFLLAAVEATESGGTVALIQPQSLLGARDAAVIRERIDEVATLVHCWTDDGSSFDASVDVCAPVLRVAERPNAGPDAGSNDWLGPLAKARGTPMVAVGVGHGVVGDLATVVAGFRDEYYGLVDAVRDGGDGPRLVTSGSIDPLRLRDEPVRFAKRRWTNPTVDIAGVTGRAAQWVETQAAPKLVVASQTKVLEAVVDDDGSLVAGVPALAVVAHDPADLWRLAAAIHAPAASAWMLQRTVGTGLSADSCRPTSTLVAQLPLPADQAAWRLAERRARELAGGAQCWEAFAIAADAAYGIDDPELRKWWLERLPLR